MVHVKFFEKLWEYAHLFFSSAEHKALPPPPTTVLWDIIRYSWKIKFSPRWYCKDNLIIFPSANYFKQSLGIHHILFISNEIFHDH